MSSRAVAARLILTALLSFGLGGLSSYAAETVSPPPVPLVTNVAGQRVVFDTILVSNTFAGFVPGSLAAVVWAGFHTNGRSTRIWEEAQFPPGWPTNPPVLRWNTNNLMWGRKGMTAISQVCEGEGAFGQGGVIALTRRHGYVRGHSMGPSGFNRSLVGHRVWYCTRDNQVIQRRVQLAFVRAPGSTQGDYSIFLLDADLPPEIEPLRVADAAQVGRRYEFLADLSHKPIFMVAARGLRQRRSARLDASDSRRGFRQPGHAAAARRTGLYSSESPPPRPAPRCRPTWTCSAAKRAWTRANTRCNGSTWTRIPTTGLEAKPTPP